MRLYRTVAWAREAAIAAAAASGLAALLCLAWAPAAGAQVMRFQDEKAMWEQHFSTIPDADHMKGSGWQVFNRWLWFYEPRVDPVTGFVPQGARWNAYLQQQQINHLNQNRSTGVWTDLGPTDLAGRATPIAIDPANHNRILLGSASGGLWESLDGAQSWHPVDDQLPSLAVGAILFDTTNPGTIYIGTGEGNFSADAVFGVGVLQSTDNGVTWNVFGSGLTWGLGDGHSVEKLVQNPNTGQIIAAATTGVYQLIGTTWTRTLTGTATALAYRTDGATTWYAGLGNPNGGAANGVYTSTDDGATWTKLANGFPTSLVGRLDIAECAASLNTIYCGISKPNGQMLGIYKTTDAGASWNLAYNGQNHYSSQGWYDLVIAVDPTNANTVYSAGLDMWKSTDGGTTFTHKTFWNGGGNTYVHADHHGWAFNPDNHLHVYDADDGGFFESLDGGNTWAERTTGLETLQFYDIDVAQNSESFFNGGSQDNGSEVSTVPPAWSQILGGDGFHSNIDWAKADTEYMEIYYGDHYRTYNAGAAFPSLVHINNGIGEQGQWDTPVLLDNTDDSILYTAHRIIYKTTNRGQQWVGKTAALPGIGQNLAQSPSNPNVLYASYVSHSVYQSTDRGETWTAMAGTGLPGKEIFRMAVHPTDPNTVFASLGGFSANSVMKTTDGGSTWTSITGNLPALPCPSIAVDPNDANTIYVGTDLGCWQTTDGGTTWAPFGTGLPNGVVSDLKIRNSQRLLYCAVYGRGMWVIGLGNPASVGNDSPTPGGSLALTDVFPNPLHTDRATVRFTLPQAGRTRVQLFDASGRLIETPLDREMPAGTSHVEWTTRARNGVYFVTVREGQQVTTGKLTIER